MRYIYVVLNMCIAGNTLAQQALPQINIPSENNPGYHTHIELGLTSQELFEGAPNVPGATDQSLRESLEHRLERSYKAMEEKGIRNGFQLPIGPRELSVSRYYSNIDRFIRIQNNRRDIINSPIIDIVVHGTVSDIRMLDSYIYGTEVDVEVIDYIKSPHKRTKEDFLRVRLITNRLVDPRHDLQGKEVRSTRAHEPKFRIGDEVVLHLTSIPFNARTLTYKSILKRHPELLYKTRITVEEGFYEMLSLRSSPIVKDGYFERQSEDRSKSEKISISEYKNMLLSK